MCNCIDTIDALLKDRGQALLATEMDVWQTPVIGIALIQRGRWTYETRTDKPRIMIAKFCPFCGEAYASAVPSDVQDQEQMHDSNGH